MMTVCFQCQMAVIDMGHKAPEGWLPFGWGPGHEDPQHYYVFSEDTPDSPNGQAQKLEVVRLCEIPNPVKRNDHDSNPDYI